MSESTTPAQCRDEDWNLARDCGLMGATPGTNAWDAALGRFADCVRTNQCAATLREIALAATVCPEVAGYTPSQVIAHLTVELSAARDRLAGGEPVGHVYTMEALVPGASRKYHAQLYVDLPVGTKLYAAPAPASPAALTMVDAAAHIERKAEDYAREFCYSDMGGLSFGQGDHAQVKMDHYTSLTELADELRALAAAEDARASRPSDCTRSHPHEAMSAECEAKTVAAREANAARQQGALSEAIEQVSGALELCEPEDEVAFEVIKAAIDEQADRVRSIGLGLFYGPKESAERNREAIAMILGVPRTSSPRASDDGQQGALSEREEFAAWVKRQPLPLSAWDTRHVTCPHCDASLESSLTAYGPATRSLEKNRALGDASPRAEAQAERIYQVRAEQHRLSYQQGKEDARAEAYKDSTPQLHVGDSSFESWYEQYAARITGNPKQTARDAYAAGMGDPLVVAVAAPPPRAEAPNAEKGE